MDLAQSLNETKPGLNDDWLTRAALVSILTLWAEPAGAAQALAPLRNISGLAKQISEWTRKGASLLIWPLLRQCGGPASKG